ncbi:hypothetical protein D3C81_1062970 [compost metagenome]
MASGNQVNKGICADLPVAAINNKMVMLTTVISPTAKFLAAGNTVENSKEPKVPSIKNTASRKPKSPILFITNAFFAAFAYELFLYQKPINK